MRGKQAKLKLWLSQSICDTLRWNLDNNTLFLFNVSVIVQFKEKISKQGCKCEHYTFHIKKGQLKWLAWKFSPARKIVVLVIPEGPSFHHILSNLQFKLLSIQIYWPMSWFIFLRKTHTIFCVIEIFLGVMFPSSNQHLENYNSFHTLLLTWVEHLARSLKV